MNAQEQEKPLSALYHLSPDMPESDWWRVGAALRSESENLFEAFDQWSSGGKSYKGTQDCRRVWNAHPPKPGGINIGTLYAMAMAQGWKQPKATKAGHTTQIKPAPTPAPAPTEAPKPANPVYDLLNIWERATPATAQHPYCLAKGVSNGPALEGLRVLPSNDPMQLTAKNGIRYGMAGALLVPLRLPDGTLQAGQCITQTGTKADGSPKFDKFNLAKCKQENGYHLIGQIQAGQPVHIVEGIGAAWATFQATSHASAVTFGVGRTKTVAHAIQQHHPEAWPVLVPDVGQEAQAQKWAKELVCAVVTLPGDWGNNADAWDYLQAHGPEALADLLAAATQPSKLAPQQTLTDHGDSLIPRMDERPAYRVFDDWIEAAGEKFRSGVWLFGSKTVGKGENATIEPTQKRICTPLHIDAGTCDAHDGSYGRLLRFQTSRGGYWQTWAMPMRLLAGDGTQLCETLFDRGVLIEDKPALIRYLQAVVPDSKSYLQCVLQPGWVDSKCRAFALPDGVIGPDAASVVYQNESKADSDFGTAGTLQGWQDGIAAMAVGNPMLALSLCAAFAGPVLAKVNAESGGPHLIGASSTGKSSLMAGAVSVWGSPAYKRGWRTTSNGLEAVAATFNDALLALDEISEADPKDVGATVYMLGNGQGKQRADRTGGFRRVARWRVSVLSNGERSIATSMAEGGYRIKAGQEVRVFDVPCTNRAHGVWDVLHGHPDGRALSDSIKNEAKAHYGHAGRAFVATLANEGADLGELLATIRAMPELSTDGEGQEQRVAGRFAVLAMAGELATGYGITGWPVGEATRATGAGFAAWRNARDTKGGKNSEQGQIVQAITDFIDKHGDSRFSDADMPPDPTRPVVVRDRAGYWRNTDTGRVYLFNSVGMREALKGFDFGRAIAYLQEMGMVPPPGNDGKSAKSLTIQGDKSRLYEVHPYAVTGGAV